MSQVGKATVTLEVDAREVPQQVRQAAEKAANNLQQGLAGAARSARKEGEVAGAALGSGIERGTQKANEVLARVGAAGLPGVQKAAESVSAGLTSSFEGAANRASTALRSVGSGNVFEKIVASAQSAGSGMSTGLSNGARSGSMAINQAAGSAQRALASLERSSETSTGGIASGLRRAGQAAGQAGTDISRYLKQPLQEAETQAARLPSVLGRIAGGLAAVAGPAMVLKSGFKRQMDLQRSQIMFENLGLSAEDTKQQLAQLSEQVTGTSVSLSDAAKYSAMFAQSGVEMGVPMNSAIKAFTALSSIAEGSGVDVGRVMQQISAQGKVTGQDIMQMADAGVNATKYLADHMGLSQEEVKKAISGGQVSFEDFVAAINEGTGDLAKQMGQTLPAKIGNLKTALANLGATIIEPFLPGITAAVEFGIAIIKKAVGPLKDLLGWFKEGSREAQIFGDLLLGVATVAGVGLASNLLGSLVQVTKQLELARRVAELFNFAFLTSPIGLVTIAIAGAAVAFAVLWRKSEAFREFWTGVWGQIKTTASDAFEYVSGVWGQVTDFASGVWNILYKGDFTGGIFGLEEDSVAVDYLFRIRDAGLQVRDTFKQVGEFVSGVWDIFAHSDYTGLGFGIEEDDKIVDVLFHIRDAAELAWDGLKQLGAVLVDAARAVQPAVWETIQSVFRAMFEVGKALTDAVLEIGRAVWDLGQALAPVLVPILKILGFVIGGTLIAGFMLLAGALKAVAEVIRFVAEAMKWLAEVIVGPVIDALGTVIAWLVDKFSGALSGMIDWFAGLTSWLIETVPPAFGTVRDAIDVALTVVQNMVTLTGDVIRGLYGNYVAPMVAAVRGGFDQAGRVVTGFKDAVVGALRGAGGWLIDAGRAIAQGLINGIKGMFGAVAETASGLAGRAKSAAKRVLGIRSPSRVFAEIGHYVGEGMARGMNDSRGLVSSAVEGLASTATRVGARVVGDMNIPSPTGLPGDFTGELSARLDDGVWEQQGADLVGFAAVVDQQTRGVINPAIVGVGQQATTMGATVWQPAMTAIGAGMSATGAEVVQTVGTQITPALRQVGAEAWAALSAGVDPALLGMRGALSMTTDAFGNGVSMIAGQWARLREATAQPVRFAIQSVFNDGLVGMWNSVSDMLGTSRMAPYPVRFASGGLVSGPGGPRDDQVPALLSDGEFVIRADAVRRIGLRNLHALNEGGIQVADGALATRRSRRSVFADAAFQAVASRYAGGGIVRGSRAWNQLKRGWDWARALSGRAYVLGGDPVGGGGTDCSGYVSSVADRIQGGPGHRRWATMSFNGGGNTQAPSGPQGFIAGLAPGFSIGVTNGGAAGGHTAGTIGGVEGLPATNVEAGGFPSRVKFGAGAVGADHSQFRTRFHLPLGANGAFVSGGTSGGADWGAVIDGILAPHRDRMRAAVMAVPKSGGVVDELPGAVATRLGAAMTRTIDRLVEKLGQDPGGHGVQRWAPLVRFLLGHYGHPSSWLEATLRRMNQESGGNPRAINNWDVNARNGDPSKGLMQVIGSTFAAYRDRSFVNSIWDPKANVAASMRYAMARYGSLPAAYNRPGGYHDGGVMGPGAGWFHKTAFSPERVLSPRQTVAFDRLVDWLDGMAPSQFGAGQGSSAERVTSDGKVRQVMVTQNIVGGDSEDTARRVEDRLLDLLV